MRKFWCAISAVTHHVGRGIAGATELRDGTVALVLDLPRLIQRGRDVASQTPNGSELVSTNLPHRSLSQVSADATEDAVFSRHRTWNESVNENSRLSVNDK